MSGALHLILWGCSPLVSLFRNQRNSLCYAVVTLCNLIVSDEQGDYQSYSVQDCGSEEGMLEPGDNRGCVCPSERLRIRGASYGQQYR